jgi:hypothetical protein
VKSKPRFVELMREEDVGVWRAVRLDINIIILIEAQLALISKNWQCQGVGALSFSLLGSAVSQPRCQKNLSLKSRIRFVETVTKRKTASFSHRFCYSLNLNKFCTE